MPKPSPPVRDRGYRAGVPFVGSVGCALIKPHRQQDVVGYRSGMGMALQEVAREAVQLPREQRLVLAAILMELDDPPSEGDVAPAWDTEIQARAQAVQAGRVVGIPYEDALARVDRRLRS
jgi:hypothetical protein